MRVIGKDIRNEEGDQQDWGSQGFIPQGLKKGVRLIVRAQDGDGDNTVDGYEE